jgi:hypothetical protein
METGHEQAALGNIGRGDPTDQWHQQDGGRILAPPQTKTVFLVADEPTALAGFERAPAQRGVPGSVSGGVFFLGSSGITWGIFIGLFEGIRKQTKKLLEWKL